jgi:hemolysin III
MPSPQRQPMSRFCPDEIEADFAVHLIGMTIGIFSALVLLVLGARSTKPAVFYSVLAYSVGLMAMLTCSAVYHLRRASDRRDLLRRLDHAAIFVMIAGTYTPFTVCILSGWSAVWMTGSIWLAAIAGATVKLTHRRRYELGSTAVYLVMGWAVIIFMQPLVVALDPRILILLVSGGVLYTIGAYIHHWRRLPFHDAIWHSLVLGAAGLHYTAIVYGIVLPTPAS